jgi:predicted amidohydrolase YtcJ
MQGMKRQAGRIGAGLLAAALLGNAMAIDVIEHVNGYTVTGGNALQQFQAMAIDDGGKIIAVGSSADVARMVDAKAAGKPVRRIDMQGKTLLPGLIDAHGHVLELGLASNALQLREAKNLAQAQKMIAAYAKKHARQEWLTGFGWNQVVWQLGRFPTAKEIDSVVSDRPVLLERVDGHASWVNSRALALAGIDKNTPDPEGGKIERDANGNPTGVLVDKASSLVFRLIPPESAAQMRQALDSAMQQLAQAGLTSVHDAGVSVAADALYRDYAASGKLRVRVYGMIRGVGSDFDQLSKDGPLPGMSDDHYALRAVKLFADGALGSRGAALLQPYADAPHSKGLLFMDAATMQQQVAKAAGKGYQVNVHAIGDAGNAQVLDALASAQAGTQAGAQAGAGTQSGTQAGALRHRVEHAQVVALADIGRFAQLGVIPSMQPVHATSDKNMAEARVGPERIRGAYAWRSFLQQGSRIACGSDFPVESPNPFEGLHAAVTRQDADGSPLGGWHPDQAMSVFEALRCFTLDAAYAAHQENALGSLEPGKWADFVLVDQDLFKMSIYDLHKIKVLQTWVGGKRVYLRK